MPSYNDAPEHQQPQQPRQPEQPDEGKLTINRDTVRDLDAADGGELKTGVAAATNNLCGSNNSCGCGSYFICR